MDIDQIIRILTSPAVFIFGAILYALGFLTKWAAPHISDFITRAKRKIATRRNVTVIVDYRKMRRHCFWRDIYGTSEDIRLWTRFRYVSIGDELDKRRNIALQLFDRRKTDIIIVNWDSINGDPVYGSDRALIFFEHYRPDMTDWLRGGGIIIVESQGASWGAVQRSYEAFSKCFIDGEVKVTEELYVTGEDVMLDPGNTQHSIFQGVLNEDLILKRGSLAERKKWFPADSSIPSLREISHIPRKIYRGYFQTNSEWKPLILSKQHQKPVMIFKVMKDVKETGVCILSTMFLASSDLDKLIVNLLVRLPGEVRNI